MTINNADKSSRAEYDIALVGHFSRDIIITMGNENRRSGGAVYFGSIAAVRAGAKVAVITKVPEVDIPLLEPMKQHGVDIFPIICEKGTSIKNEYFDTTMERRKCTAISFAGAYEIEKIPSISAKIWHIAGLIKGEADTSLMKDISKMGMLSADAQGFVRVIRGSDMVYEDWIEKTEVLPLLKFFKTDAAEAEILTGFTDVKDAARSLADMGAKEIALTHPGGLLVHTDGKFWNTPFTPRQVLGRTGRGDTTMCSYLSRRLTHSPEESCLFAATLCSIKMEFDGPFSGTIDDVEKRMKSVKTEMY